MTGNTEQYLNSSFCSGSDVVKRDLEVPWKKNKVVEKRRGCERG